VIVICSLSKYLVDAVFKAKGKSLKSAFEKKTNKARSQKSGDQSSSIGYTQIQSSLFSSMEIRFQLQMTLLIH
jgi:hypothetical protein